VGVSYLLGIHTPPNFDRPFLAGNIAEFWNRWHISLSTWFRDHVYRRFVMAAVRGRWFASRLAISCAALYVTFMLMGIWHGLSLRYVTYGLYHGTLLPATRSSSNAAKTGSGRRRRRSGKSPA
jgi:membrane protein involved in D-alanine export